jgi:hypothetical protein
MYLLCLELDDLGFDHSVASRRLAPITLIEGGMYEISIADRRLA